MLEKLKVSKSMLAHCCKEVCKQFLIVGWHSILGNQPKNMLTFHFSTIKKAWGDLLRSILSSSSVNGDNVAALKSKSSIYLQGKRNMLHPFVLFMVPFTGALSEEKTVIHLHPTGPTCTATNRLDKNLVFMIILMTFMQANKGSNTNCWTSRGVKIVCTPHIRTIRSFQTYTGNPHLMLWIGSRKTEH